MAELAVGKQQPFLEIDKPKIFEILNLKTLGRFIYRRLLYQNSS